MVLDTVLVFHVAADAAAGADERTWPLLVPTARPVRGVCSFAILNLGLSIGEGRWPSRELVVVR